MNILSLAHGRVSAKLFAGITIVSLLVSALPASFFAFNFAEAAGSTMLFSENFESDLSQWPTVTSAWSIIGSGGGSDGSKFRATGVTGGLGVTKSIKFSTVGFENIRVNYDFRGNLSASDSAGFGYNPGSGNFNISSFNSSNAGDGVWKNAPEGALANADDTAEVELYLSGSFSAVSDQFDIDNIVVTGDPIQAVDPITCSFAPTFNGAAENGDVTYDWNIEYTGDISGVSFAAIYYDDVFQRNASAPAIATNGNAILAFADQPVETFRIDLVDDNQVVVASCEADVPAPPETPILGCMEEEADNYNPDATEAGDVICEYEDEEEEEEPEEAPDVCYYEGVATATQGNKNNTDPVNADRSLFSSVENGVASYSNFFGQEPSWSASDFYSLGIGGELVYEFTDKIALDQAGPDIAIWEITGGNADSQSAESADVYLSENGIDYELAGTVIGDGTVDISATTLDFVKFVKLVDQSAGVQGPNGDGYDVDAITIIDGSCSDFATVHTTKIVCDLESELPNWGGGAANITETTATDWLIANANTSCRAEEGWEFEWAPKSTSNPGNSLVGTGGSDWTTFVGTGVVPASVIEADNAFWMREVLQADYIPFTSGQNNNVSAEMYCHKDVLNYDNFDRIDQPEVGEDYYCVAWNVPVEPEPTQCTVTIKSDETNTVLEKGGAFAVVLDYIHPNWTESLSDADWIWGDQGPTDPSQSEVQTFVNQFGWNGDVITDATLTITADNTFSASLNGAFAGEELGASTFTATTDYDVAGLIDNGNNELSVVVENFAGNQDSKKNPAGLYYELVINGEGENCDVPYVPEPEEPEEPEYGPYCGDGEQNQLWEQCDGGADCTDYCTLTNQCSAEQLIKITLEEDTEATSFDGAIHLDMAGNVIPNGTWFSFGETVGSENFVSIANAVEGLAVDRDLVNNKLVLAFVGGNGTKQIDNAKGTIMTKGISLGTVDRSPNPSFKLEDGSGSTFDDVFDKNPNESIDFDLRADTGNDGVSVEIEAGDEYDCPECKATVEARVVLNENGQTGNGDLNEQVILGDAGYTTVEFGEWFPISVIEAGDTSATMILDPNTVTNFDNPGDKAGLFVSREGGTIKVGLYGNHNPGGNNNNEWIDARIEIRDAEITNFSNLSGNFKLENHSETDGVPTNDGSDTAVADTTGVDFRLWVDTASDGFRFNIDHDSIVACEDDTEEAEETETIQGKKYFDENGNGIIDQGEEGYEGWLITVADIETGETFSTTTDANGEYSFEVPAGEWEVTEESRKGWALTAIYENDQLINTEQRGESCFFNTTGNGGFETARAYLSLRDSNICDFYNTLDDNIGEDTYTITGTKYELVGETRTPLPGWTINLFGFSDTPVQSTTTDSSGNYSFTVTGGDWQVAEELQIGWMQVDAERNGFPAKKNQDGMAICNFGVGEQEAFAEDSAQVEYNCDFINERVEEEPEEPGGNGNGSSAQRFSTRVATPAVLGAETTNFCPFLTEFMQMGVENDEMEVMKLQLFLNMFRDTFGGTENPVNGEFGATTDANVKAFQQQYSSEILQPWFDQGIVPHNRPTGFVYKTTLWKINSIVCPDYAVLPDFAGEDLTQNVNID